MPNNWDGQISAKVFYEFMKKVSELSKSGDDFSKISFKVWDNSDRKSQNPSYPDYTISFKIGDGNSGNWSSVISIWKSKPKDNISSGEDDLENLLGNNTENTDDIDNGEKLNINKMNDDEENYDDETNIDDDNERKIKPEELPF